MMLALINEVGFSIDSSTGPKHRYVAGKWTVQKQGSELGVFRMETTRLTSTSTRKRSEMEQAMKERSPSRTHALVMPFPGHGHMGGLLQLTLKLLSHGVCATVVTTPKNATHVEPLLNRGLPVRLLVLPLPSPPAEGIAEGTESMAGLHPMLIPRFMLALMRAFSGPIEYWFSTQALHQEFGRPHCIISDMFMGWTAETSERLRIPRLVFYTSSAFACGVINSIWKHLEHLRTDVSLSDQEAPVSIPEVFPLGETLKTFELTPSARSFQKGDPIHEDHRYNMMLNQRSWGALVNTFDALEGQCLDHFRAHSGAANLWSVGPLLQAAESPSSSEYSAEVADCLRWMDGQPTKSVVYVCFGTQAKLSPAQAAALALGMERSGECFVWVAGDAAGDLGEGFAKRERERGRLIRGWAPQRKILEHPAVACFVTHCGWNSVLEGLCAGLPLITWPLSYDQHYNERVLVDHAKVGVSLCRGKLGVPCSERIADVIKEMMRGRHGEYEAKHIAARALRSEAVRAFNAGGSSHTNVLELVAALKKCQSHPQEDDAVDCDGSLLPLTDVNLSNQVSVPLQPPRDSMHVA